MINKLSINEYDAMSKHILSDKQVLANIMKECIPEYSNLSRKEIIDLIEDGKSNRYIVGLPTDDLKLDNNEIKYDILYTSRLPNSNELIGMYINIEAQNKDSLGYPVIKRAIYYASRLLSNQKGLSFEKSEYHKIKKVYSIWISTTPTKQKRNSINTYSICEHNARGAYKEVEENYKLINVVMLNLGNNIDDFKKNTGILEMLGLIFKNEAKDYKTTNKLLKDRYNIINNESEGLDMCSLGEGIYREGKAEGLIQGKAEGSINTNVFNIHNLMSSLNLTFEQALDALKIDDSIKDQVIKTYKEKYN